MYDDPIFQLEMKAQNILNARSPQTTLSQPTLSQPTLSQQSVLFDQVAPPSAIKLANSTLVLFPLGLIALWTIAVICFNLQKKPHGIGKGLKHRQFRAVPCRRCAFFKDSPYLKCAINPVNALTVNAIDCTDYTPHPFGKK